MQLARPYDHYKDLETLKMVLISRNMPAHLAEHLPEIGYVSEHEGKIVGFAFLRKIEGGFGLLDGIVTDPSLPHKVRSDAVDLLVSCIIHRAKTGMKKLICYSRLQSILERSLKHGFIHQPDILLMMDL